MAATTAAHTAQTPATYIARCAGLCKEDDVKNLQTLLQGMCVRRYAYDENEYGLEFPLQSGTRNGSFKMIKMVSTAGPLVPLGPQPPTIWRLVQESPPLRGNPYNSLPATVLEVTESALSGIYAVQFMHGLGCQQKYRVQRKNNVFVCMHEDREVEVSMFSVFSRPGHQQEAPVPMFDGYAVEAKITSGPEQQVDAAKKLGTFCQKLLPFVVLKKIQT